MDKDIQMIGKKIFNLLRTYSVTSTPISISNKFDYLKDNQISNKYGNSKIFEIIVLYRIERLYDLGKIDYDEKMFLIRLYDQYKKIYDEIGNDLHEELINKKSYDKLNHFLLRNKLNVISDKLNEYSLLEEFDYENAFITEIDSKIIKKK